MVSRRGGELSGTTQHFYQARDEEQAVKLVNAQNRINRTAKMDRADKRKAEEIKKKITLPKFSWDAK